ncbi:MAG: LPXTG cell wall anchor domain-containing protein [Clostridia bacterium]|nr:LPXTG cell wall anchor domain-containing protein [Clostridia bacterium]
MAAVSNTYLGKHKKFRTDTKKLATAFLVTACIIAVIVFWWLKLIGITATADAFCGMKEHTHTDDCYAMSLVCGFDESESTPAAEQTDEITSQTTVTTDTQGETATTESHTHTDACYKNTLVCTETVHLHTKECFPDKTADVETVSDWLATLEDVKITNNIPENLLAVAMTQMGYTESSKNFELSEDGEKNGYTRYGEWYGNPYGKWNVMFVSFCLHYSNINNVTPLKSAGANAMQLAWTERSAFASADEDYTPQRGDLVFYDTDEDKTADRVAIILALDSKNFVVIEGDSNNATETKSLPVSEHIIGYGQTSKLSFAKDMTYQAETTETATETQTPTAEDAIAGNTATDTPVADDTAAEEIATEEATTQQITVQLSPPMLFATAPNPNIEYVTDLTKVITNVSIETLDGVPIQAGGTVYIGQMYTISMSFSEDNTSTPWLQFQHDGDHLLHYQLPENLECEPFESWHPITARTEDGTIMDVGEYFVDNTGHLRVRFFDDENGQCFASKYSNVQFTIDFNAAVAATQSGTSTDVVFNDEIHVNLELDGSAAMNVTKTHGSYNSDDHTMEYTIRVEATQGLVKDLVIDDQIWENHFTLRDTIVVTDLEGNVLDPQPVVSDHPSHNNGANEGFRLSGFPDFSAGNGFLITYKTQIYDDMLVNETVEMWNGLDSTGKNSKGEDVYVWSADWLRVELEKMEKDGKQTVLEDANGNPIPVIEWEVEIKKDNHNLQGTVIIDTLGEGLAYYTGKDIRIKHYDALGNRLEDAYISWDDVTVNGDTMSFALPEGYEFVIVYYSTYEDLAEGEMKNYTNRVTATINGKEESAGGDADVVGFVPRVRKSASGNDGEFVYFTIEAEVPAVIKDWGGFFLTDLAAFWGYDGNAEGHLYVENIPQDMVVTAVTESGRTINFTPYVAGGPTENTFILVSPASGNQHHSFNVFFNTSTPDIPSSKWILDENAVLTVTYKLPFDAATGVEWEGPLTGDKTLEDLLLEGRKMANEAYFNYTEIIQGTGITTYEYAPQITKKSTVHEDGTIDYTVVFHNTIPGSHGDEGYLNATTASAYFTDTFDEKLEYVPGSLKVTCYDPWRDGLWMNKYAYNGAVSGNSMNNHASLFEYTESNPDATAVGWSNLYKRTDLEKFYKWVNAGGDYVFTYTLKVKDEYLYSTEENNLVLDNTAELTWNEDNTSGPVTEESEFNTGLLDKHVVQRESRLNFDIHINRNALDILPGTDKLTIDDTMTENLSVYWSTIKLYYEDTDGTWVDFDNENSRHTYTVTFDQATNKLTFEVPDSLHIRIDYTTLITENGLVSVSNAVKIDGKAQVSDLLDALFQVEEHSGDASASIHNITLLKQDGTTNIRLPGVTFHLYGPTGNQDATVPDGAEESIAAPDNKTLSYIGSYTTGADGTVFIETQYLTTTGGPFAFVEDTPPAGYNPLEEPVYFYFYKTDPDGIIQTVTTIIAIENYTYGFVLPETGGTGTLPFTILGIAFMAVPVLYCKIRRKRERRLT